MHKVVQYSNSLNKFGTLIQEFGVALKKNTSPSANKRDLHTSANHIFSNHCTKVGTTYKEHVH